MGKFKYEVYDYSKIEICKPKKFQATVTVALSDAAERELTAIFSEQIAREIDRSILTSLNLSHNSAGPTFAPTYISNEEDFLNVYSNG